MKTIAITLGFAALMIPAAAQAGHYGQPACHSASTVKVECTRGVKIYRAKPVQYAPGHLEQQIYAKRQAESARAMSRQRAQFQRKLNAQNMKITALENKIEKLEQSSQRRRRGQFIQGVGFGTNFLSPQRAPGFDNLQPGPAFRPQGAHYHK